MTEGLKPCPKCGYHPVEVKQIVSLDQVLGPRTLENHEPLLDEEKQKKVFWVICPKCGFKHGVFQSVLQAKERWNTYDEQKEKYEKMIKDEKAMLEDALKDMSDGFKAELVQSFSKNFNKWGLWHPPTGQGFGYFTDPVPKVRKIEEYKEKKKEEKTDWR